MPRGPTSSRLTFHTNTSATEESAFFFALTHTELSKGVSLLSELEVSHRRQQSELRHHLREQTTESGVSANKPQEEKKPSFQMIDKSAYLIGHHVWAQQQMIEPPPPPLS
eukprot:superscaffoldBa00006009_g21029